VLEHVTASRVALLGGVYGNDLALEAVLADAAARGAEMVYCLGDVGGFGPDPDGAIRRLRESDVRCVQGNYDVAVAQALADCGCGYSDPRDNAFARISYAFTLAHTDSAHRRWLGVLPPLRLVVLGRWRVLLAHGSPRQINEFLWETTTPNGLLDAFCRDWDADVLAVTHTGLKWHRALPSGRHAINVGAVGRPENDGSPRVWYTLLTAAPDLEVQFVPVAYDHETVAREMEHAGLPAEFSETIRTGWWTCCLEAMPVKERARGRY
jgi:diadenosine tetraphosphatase ApaH/serine/threonine PP2A family protein phosphatase